MKAVISLVLGIMFEGITVGCTLHPDRGYQPNILTIIAFTVVIYLFLSRNYVMKDSDA